MTLIKAQTSLNDVAFTFARDTANVWFGDPEKPDNVVVVRLSAEDMKHTEVRERVCSLAGNSYGLGSSLVAALKAAGLKPGDDFSLELTIYRTDEKIEARNHPREVAEQVREALP